MRVLYTLILLTFCVSILESSQVIYFSEDFQGGRIPTNMKIIDNDGNTPRYSNWANGNAWIVLETDATTKNLAAASTSYYNPPGQADDWLITPQINIGDDAYLTWTAVAWAAEARDGYQVLVSTTGNNMADFNTVVFEIAAENAFFTDRIVSLKEKGFRNQSIYIAFRNNSNDKFVLSVDNIKVFKPATYDLSILSLNLDRVVHISQAPFMIRGDIFNFGTATVESFDINYQINDGPVITEPVDALIEFYKKSTYYHMVDWEPETVGTYLVKVWASNINGNPDQNPDNDALYASIIVYDESILVPQLPMHEIFTSATCPPCKPGNEHLDGILNQRPGKYAIVKYQMNWPGTGDIYYTAEGGVRRDYYGISSVPTFVVQGTPIANYTSYTLSMLDQLNQNYTFIEMVPFFSINPALRRVDANVNISATTDIIDPNLTVHLAVVESITRNNVATNGETEFHYVMKKMLPNATGTRVGNLAAGEVKNITLNYVFPANNTVENWDNLMLVAFIQNHATKAMYQSAWGIAPPEHRFDMSVTIFTLPEVFNLDKDEPLEIKGEIRNLGSEVITSFDLNYSVNYGPNVTTNISGVSLPLGSSYSFTHPEKWMPEGVGDNVVTVWASNLNGNADQKPENDKKSATVFVVDATNSTQKLPLFEVFTSATCPPCKPGNEYLDGLLNNNPNKWSVVKYQMNWPGNGDRYYTTEGGVRRDYYGVSSVPDLYVEGVSIGVPQQYTQANLINDYEAPAFFELDATYSVDEDSRVVEVTVNHKALRNIPNSQVVAHIAVVENVTRNNVATNGETEFHYVMKKMMPGASGRSIMPITVGVLATDTKTYTFPTNHTVEDFNNLSVVVFLQNNTNKRVLQSTWATQISSVKNNAPAGMGIIGVFPNPSQGDVFVRYQLNYDSNVDVNVFNVNGDVVYSNNIGMQSQGPNDIKLNLSELATGTYIVNLTIDGYVFSQKVNIVR